MKESEPITADTKTKVVECTFDGCGTTGTSGSNGGKGHSGKWYDVYYKKRRR